MSVAGFVGRVGREMVLTAQQGSVEWLSKGTGVGTAVAYCLHFGGDRCDGGDLFGSASDDLFADVMGDLGGSARSISCHKSSP